MPQDGPKPGINVPDGTHGKGGNLGGNTLHTHAQRRREPSGSRVHTKVVVQKVALPLPVTRARRYQLPFIRVWIAGVGHAGRNLVRWSKIERAHDEIGHPT